MRAMEQAGLVQGSGALGVVAWSGGFQRIVDGLERMFDAEAVGQVDEVVRFPPVMARGHFETSGYMKGFPQLAGSVHCFCGSEADHRILLACIAEDRDWTGQQQATDVILTPACCYPLYPLLARRGPLPPGGVTVDIASWCYRQEPSEHPARMRSFRVREFVRAGTAEDVAGFRAYWMDRARGIAESLALEAAIDVANDPFFGRPGKLRAGMQREEEAKFELLIAVEGPAPTACASFNDAKDLFGTLFGLVQHDGAVARTGCVGFGVERMCLALLRRHGLESAAWPAGVRATLGL